MKIKYTFINGETSEVEVSEEIGNFIIEATRKEEANNRKERYHSWSIDSVDYGNDILSVTDFTEQLFEEKNSRIYNAFSKLTKIQKRRIIMLSNGLSEREIARLEGVNIRAVFESIEAARKKFLKNF